MAGETRSVRVRLSADVAEGVRNVRKFSDETKRSMGEAEKAATRSGRALDDLGGTAGKVGLAAATGLALVGKAAMDWESDWAGVSKTVDGTAAQMAVLEGELRGLATTLPATHSEIAGVAEAAGQLGVAREDVSGFTKTMVDLGETTNLTAEDAATSIAQMANVMGTAPDQVDNLGAALVALGNDGASTEAQIIQMAQRIAGAGAQIGLAESDILAIANAAASMGIEVEAGGTAVSRVFTDMAKATAQGGDKLQLFAKTAGMSARDFAAAFEADPARAFAAFTQGLDRINKSGGDVFTTLDQIGLSDVRVSQALLGMAASGDLLTDSLDLGAQAWEENTALAVEAAKRYDTTAAQTQIAWNNIKDAAIEFGDVGLPIVAGVAEGVSGLAQTIGGLPAPVKAASMSMLGVTAVLGGGLWFTAKTISGVASMRETLTGLSASTNKAERGLGKVGKAAGIAGIALGGLAVIDAFSRIHDEVLPGLEELTGQLIDLAQAGDAKAIASEYDSLGDSVERLANPRWAQALQDNISGAIGGIGAGSEVREARAELEKLDAALTGLVTTGNADTAADALQNLVEAQGLSATEAEDLLGMLPQYGDALAGIENDSKLAAGGTDTLTDSTGKLGGAAGKSADEIKDLIDAMRDQRSAAIDAANAEIGYQAALDDARASLAENGRGLDITTEKGRENKTALLDVAAAWNQQSDAAKNAPGAHAAAIRSFVTLAMQMGMGEKAARNLARRIIEIPSKKFKVEADVSQALSAVAATRNALAALRDKRVVVTTEQHTIARSPYRIARAQGGPIPGSSPHKRADNILVAATAGEYMHQVDAVNHYGLDIMDALNQRRIPKEALAGYAYGGAIGDVQHLARGGEVEKMTAADFRGFDLGRIGARETREELREFRRAVREAGGDWTKAMDRMSRQAIRVSQRFDRLSGRLETARDRLRDTREDRADYKGQLRDTFNNDPFGNGLAGFDLQVSADSNDLRAQIKAAKTLAAKGLDGPLAQALFASGDLLTMQQLAKESRASIAKREAAFAQRASLQNAYANFGGQEVFGQAIAQQTRAVQRLERQLTNIARAANGRERRIERAAARGTAEGAARGLAAVTRKGAQRQRVRRG